MGSGARRARRPFRQIPGRYLKSKHEAFNGQAPSGASCAVLSADVFRPLFVVGHMALLTELPLGKRTISTYMTRLTALREIFVDVIGLYCRAVSSPLNGYDQSSSGTSTKHEA